MPQSINTAAVESYIETLTEKLVFGHFNTHEHISGPEIQELTELDQVNVFILELLFSQWRTEAESLKSPFFNFEHEDIKSALQDFLNSLSFHIKVDRAHFQPLLKNALSNTIDLILHPYNYITQECLCLDEMVVSEAHIRNKTRYIKINKFLIEDALNKFNQKDQIPTEDFLNECSQIYLKRKGDFYAIEDLVRMFDYLIPEEHSQAFFMGHETPVLPHEHNETPSIDDFVETTIDSPEPITYNKEADIAETETQFDGEPINAKFSEKQTSLAEELADKHTVNLKDSIPFNDRYAFVNNLFDGDANEYNEALDQVQSSEANADTLSLLKDRYGAKYQWHEKEETLERLIEYLERRN